MWISFVVVVVLLVILDLDGDASVFRKHALARLFQLGVKGLELARNQTLVVQLEFELAHGVIPTNIFVKDTGHQDQFLEAWNVVEGKGLVVGRIAVPLFGAALLLAIVLVEQHIVLFQVKDDIWIRL